MFGLSVITTNIEDLSQKKLVFDFNARVQEPSEELGKIQYKMYIHQSVKF